MGNVAVGPIEYESAGSQKKTIFLMTFSSSYGAPDILAPQQVGMSKITDMVIEGHDGLTFEIDILNPLKQIGIHAYTAYGAEVSGDQSGVTVEAIAYGA